MPEYKIITDSCCDLTENEIAQMNLAVTSLSLEYQGKVYQEGEGPTPREFYDGLRGGVVAKTAAVNPEQWANVMRPMLAKGEDVLVIAFSSGLSTTYQSAVIAAEELKAEFPDRGIYVVDSLAASMGQGLLVYHAWKHKCAGESIESVYHWLMENRLRLCHWFTVDDLMYLKRGGRVSAATALVGTMLQIKPVLHVDNEGHLVNVSKARGRKASLEALVSKLEGFAEQNDVIFISHGDCSEDAKYVAKRIEEKYGPKEIRINYVGAVIGSHSGPGTVALFFLGDAR